MTTVDIQNKLRFHWMLPKGGEMTQQETARVLSTAENSYAGIPDMKSWVHFAEQAEASGIESVLFSFGSYEPDTLQIACALGQHSSKLKFIAAFRMGLMQPTLFVQQVNTVSQLIQGRLAINVIAGSSPAEQRSYGDYLAHDERYARATEYLGVCNSFWAQEGDVDYEGKYCRLEGGKLHTPFYQSDRKKPELYVSGHSSGAQNLAAAEGDCWLRAIDRPSTLAPMVQAMRQNGSEVCLRMCIVCRPTKDEAIQAAYALREDQETVTAVRQFITKSDSQFLKDALALADSPNEWLEPWLWAGLVPSFGPSVVCMVGTPEELASAFLEYKRIGITQFIISGWPKLEEMLIFSQEVMPLVRKAEILQVTH